jgi:DNA-binding MarR family transcriptional regulator
MKIEHQEEVLYFIEIMQYGNLKLAAKNLDTSQPTLTRFIQRLEERFGYKLIDIVPNGGVSLTTFGEQLYQRVKPLQQKLTAEISELYADEKNYCGTVRIAMPLFVYNTIMDKFIRNVILKYPLIDFKFGYVNLFNPSTIDLDKYDLIFLGFIPDGSQYYVNNFGILLSRLYCSDKYINKYGLPQTVDELRKFHSNKLVSPIDMPMCVTHIDSGVKELLVNAPRAAISAMAPITYLESNEFIVESVRHLSMQKFQHKMVLPEHYVTKFECCLLKHRFCNTQVINLVEKELVRLIEGYVPQLTSIFMPH